MRGDSVKLELQLALAERLAEIPFRYVKAQQECSSNCRPRQQTYPRGAAAREQKEFSAEIIENEILRLKNALQEQKLDYLDAIRHLQGRDAAIQFLQVQVSQLRQQLLERNISGQDNNCDNNNNGELMKALPAECAVLRARTDLEETLTSGEERAAQSDNQTDSRGCIDSMTHHASQLVSTESFNTMQKNSGVPLIRTAHERDARCRKYKEAVRVLKSKIAEETQRRKDLEVEAAASDTRINALETSCQLKVAAAEKSAERQVRAADTRAAAAEAVAMAATIKVAELEEKLHLQHKAMCSGACIAEKESLRQALLHERAIVSELHRKLTNERAQRAQQEDALADREASLAAVERRYRQLDAIVRRVAQRTKVHL